VSANEARKVALLARPGQARERLHQALDAAGASIVLEDDPSAVDQAALAALAPHAVLVALEPAVEDALEALGPALESPELLVIFDEADLAARREGWEMQRWIRHLAAKLHGHGDVLPPGREHENDPGLDLEPGLPQRPQELHAHERFEPYLAEAESAAVDLPEDRPGQAPSQLGPPPPLHWELADGDAPMPVPEPPRAPAPPPLPDFSTLELVSMEPEAPVVAAREAIPEPKAKGAVLVIAGIGGPDAVRKLLVALPRGFKRPVLIQLRLDGGRYDNLVKQMARVSPLPVLMAEVGQDLEPSRVYVLPDGIGLASNDGLAFCAADPGSELLESLPPAESAVLMLSGSEPSRVDAALALAARGGHVSGQALEGCYDASAIRLLSAGGIALAPPAQLAQQLVTLWG
jgi:chemosensory pili system protein ChpB (putative protein-glutamate methylesterase)